MPERRSRKQRHEEAADWVLRQSRGPLDAETEAAFRAWLARSPANRQSHAAAQQLFGEAGSAIASDPELSGFEGTPARPGPRIAGLIAALAIGVAGFLWADGPMKLRADRIAGIDELPLVTLDDGSVVQLNATAAIAVDFDAGQRVVRLLRGQAYFEVAADPDRPFAVVAGAATVTALGTAFDVRRRAHDIEVTVTEHSVRLEIDDSAATVARLREGEQGRYDTARAQLDIGPARQASALAWREGRLVLDGTPLRDVISEIDTRFSGRIIATGPAMTDRRLSGTLDITDPDAALAFLEQALGVEAIRIGPVVFIGTD